MDTYLNPRREASTILNTNVLKAQFNTLDTFRVPFEHIERHDSDMKCLRQVPCCESECSSRDGELCHLSVTRGVHLQHAPNS